MLEAILFSTATVIVENANGRLPILQNSRFCKIPDFVNFPFFFHLHIYTSVYSLLETTLFSTATVVVEYPIRMRMGASRLCDILDFAKFPILSNSRYCQFPDFAKFPVLSTSRFFFICTFMQQYIGCWRHFFLAPQLKWSISPLDASRFWKISDFVKFPIFLHLHIWTAVYSMLVAIFF